MPELLHIPMFPLTLLPLPGELVPLHIFEPRYRQLLSDAETLDIGFGIYCNHDLNKEKLGAFMKLESVIKRFSTGESDIVVKCMDIFKMDKLYRTYKSKMYPGGEVLFYHVDVQQMPSAALYELFLVYQRKRNITNSFTSFNINEIAQELNFDLYDRYKFLTASSDQKQAFLINQLKFQIHLLLQEEKSKNFYHLN